MIPNTDVSPKKSQKKDSQNTPSNQSPIEPLKRLRRRMLEKVWKEPVKPIAWHNLPWWIYQTAKTDLRHYQKQPRPLTFSKIKGIFQPNLQNPIFIIGSPRSGTTFLGDCLAEIPEISYHFEPVLIKAASRYVYTQQWNLQKAGSFYRQVYAWLMRLQGDGELRLAEKTPRNSFVIPFLARIFPDAKFIHIMRDGRDVAVSLAEKPWYKNELNGSIMREPGGYLCGSTPRFWVEPDRAAEFQTTNNIHRCIWLWRRYIEAAVSGLDGIPFEQRYELKYENLVANPQRETQGLLDFLAIESENSRSLFEQAIITQIRADSVGKWQRVLNENELEQIAKEASVWLQKCGYVS